MKKEAQVERSDINLLLANVKYSVACGIEVTNLTKFELIEPAFSVKSGHISKPPVSIKPNTTEVMITHKRGYALSGSSGLVSWLVKDKSMRIFVIWESPYFTSNKLAVGVTNGNPKHNEAWFDYIKNNPRSSHTEYKFKHAEFQSTGRQIMVEDDEFEILGTMGSSSKSIIQISFRSKNQGFLSKTPVPITSLL